MYRVTYSKTPIHFELIDMIFWFTKPKFLPPPKLVMQNVVLLTLFYYVPTFTGPIHFPVIHFPVIQAICFFSNMITLYFLPLDDTV